MFYLEYVLYKSTFSYPQFNSVAVIRGCSAKKGVLENFAEFTRKHLPVSRLPIKKGTGVFLRVLKLF